MLLLLCLIGLCGTRISGGAVVRWCTKAEDCMGIEATCKMDMFSGQHCECQSQSCYDEVSSLAWTVNAKWDNVDCSAINTAVIREVFVEALERSFDVSGLLTWDCKQIPTGVQKIDASNNGLYVKINITATNPDLREKYKYIEAELMKAVAASPSSHAFTDSLSVEFTRWDSKCKSVNSNTLSSGMVNDVCTALACKSGPLVRRAEARRLVYKCVGDDSSRSVIGDGPQVKVRIRWCVDDWDCQEGDRLAFCEQGTCRCQLVKSNTGCTGSYRKVVVHARYRIRDETAPCQQNEFLRGFQAALGKTATRVPSLLDLDSGKEVSVSHAVVTCSNGYYNVIGGYLWSPSQVVEKSQEVVFTLSYKHSNLSDEYGVTMPVVSSTVVRRHCTSPNAALAVLYEGLCLPVQCKEHFIISNGSCIMESLSLPTPDPFANTTSTTLPTAWSNGIFVAFLIMGVVMTFICLSVTLHWALRGEKPVEIHFEALPAPPHSPDCCAESAVSSQGSTDTTQGHPTSSLPSSRSPPNPDLPQAPSLSDTANT